MRGNQGLSVFFTLKKIRQSSSEGLMGQKPHQFGRDMEQHFLMMLIEQRVFNSLFPNRNFGGLWGGCVTGGTQVMFTEAPAQKTQE